MMRAAGGLALIVGTIALSVGGVVHAETWECVVEKTKRDTAVPSTITVKINPITRTVLVSDDLTKSWGRSVVEGDVLTDTAKRQTIRWAVSGIPEQRLKNVGHGQNNTFSKIAFTISRFKKTDKMKLLIKPLGRASWHANELVRTGKCAIQK